MPLSDNEQRLLQELERALSAEDPKFASTMRGVRRPNSVVRRLSLGIAGFVVGLVVLVLGVAQKQVILSILGFVLMLAGTAYAVSAKRPGPMGVVGSDGVTRPPQRPAGKGPAKSKRKPKASGSFMQRLEQRWDRRRNGG